MLVFPDRQRATWKLDGKQSSEYFKLWKPRGEKTAAECIIFLNVLV